MGQKSKLGFEIMDSMEFMDATNAALRFDAARCHSRHSAPPSFQIKIQRNSRTESICVDSAKTFKITPMNVWWR